MLDFVSDHSLLIAGVVVAGFAAGYAGGLFGIGGGIITVPALYAVFQSLGVADGPSLKTAIGTSLGVIIVTSIRSLTTHHHAGQVDFSVLKAWAPWIALGAAAGGFFAKWAPVELLTAVFAGGAFYIAWRRVFSKTKGRRAKGNLTAKRMKIPLGVGTGLFSALMGIGGGALGVMVMTMSGRSMHQAIGTSAGFGVAVAVPGVIGFVLSGWAADDLPALSAGYVNGPAFVVMALMAGIAAPVGARLAHRVNAEFLSKLFGTYVFVAALSLVTDVYFN
ncbi:MAG: sulfite exporter TauE/SafE family protein [Pseudomonadota bacterium]